MDNNKRTWTANLAVEGLTQAEIDMLLSKMVEYVESVGGAIGGGFAPEGDEDDGEED